MIKYHDIQVPIYPFEFRLFLYDSSNKDELIEVIEKCNSYLKSSQVPAADLISCSGLTIESENGRYAMTINLSKQQEVPLINTIIHEGLHMSNRLFSKIGIETDLDNDEGQVYIQEWIITKILKYVSAQTTNI